MLDGMAGKILEAAGFDLARWRRLAPRIERQAEKIVAALESLETPSRLGPGPVSTEWRSAEAPEGFNDD